MVLADELDGHLARLALWSVVSLVVGGAALARRGRGGRSGFAEMTVGWALVNLAIVLGSSRGAPPTDAEAFRRFLGANVALNLVWIGIGAAMARARPAPSEGSAPASGSRPFLRFDRAWVRGAGAAMALQGVVLQILDVALLLRTAG